MYDPRETRHVVDINLGLLTRLGITTPAASFRSTTSIQTRRAVRVEQTGGRYALLNPGAAWPNKRWPPARLAAIAIELRARHGLMSVVLWGPGEEALAAEVVAGRERRGGPVGQDNDCGSRGAGARRGADGVGRHRADAHRRGASARRSSASTGRRVPSRNGPMSPLDVTVSRDSVCQCHHLRRCRLDRMCLLDIEVAEVLAAVERRLGAEAARG